MNYFKTLAALVLLLASATVGHAQTQVTVDFDELNDYTNDVNDPGGRYRDAHSFNSDLNNSFWQTAGVTFNPLRPIDPLEPDAERRRRGFSYSNFNDTTTVGFTNQWAAITGTDVSGNGNYVIGNSFSANQALFDLPSVATVDSIQLTNATFTALDIINGSGFSKAFGGDSGDDPDFLKVIFTGFSESSAAGSQTGSTEFFLADFRFDDNNLDTIVDQWIEVDLTALNTNGNARSIGIAFEGSDSGDFGLNTPAYVALDNLVLNVAAVPEPSATALLFLVGGTLVTRRRRLSFISR